MPYRTITQEKFGGLNLAADPQDIGWNNAVDLVNVDFDLPGQVRTRDGATLGRSIASIGTPGSVFSYQTVNGHSYLIVAYAPGSGGHAMEAYVTTDSFLSGGTAASPGNHVFSAVMFGTPSTTRAYIANGVDTIWRYDSAQPVSKFGKPAGMPLARYVALSGRSSRLVAANLLAGGGMSGGTAQPSRVAFSDAGNAEAWTYAAGPPETGNFVDLTPGDSPGITGLATWQDLLFVFKSRRFFIFYGESALGSVVEFAFREVNGYGAVDGGVTAGRRGVYFFDGTAIWLTTGSSQVPQRVSLPIEPFLRGDAAIAGHTASTSLNQVRLSYSLDRVYVNVPLSGGGTLTLIYNEAFGYWTTSDFVLSDFAPASIVIGDKQYTMGLTTNGILYFNHAATTDAGAPINWSYQTGYIAPAGGQRVTMRGYNVFGYGTNVNVQIVPRAGRPGDTSDPGTLLNLGSGPAVQEVKINRMQRGVLFANKISGTGPAIVNRITYRFKPAGFDT